MFEFVQTINQLSIGIAFLAGVITFFASCFLPLVPTYIAYLSGISASTKQEGKNRLLILSTATTFVIGFIISFLAIGLTINSVFSWLLPYQELLQKIAGLIFILMGLMLLGTYSPSWLVTERKFSRATNWFTKYRHLHALFVGLSFGFAWTPCIGPIFSLILYTSSQAATQLQGLFFLFWYGLGIGLPFLVIAAGFEFLNEKVKKLGKLGHYLNMLAGIIILLTGILLVIGEFSTLSIFILQIFKLRSLAI